ncbi:MAG: D-alanyl-D-alanine carboxypeptidase/D-alanyl-D-alanine-endopeptidase [Chlamydiota bacterium]
MCILFSATFLNCLLLHCELPLLPHSLLSVYAVDTRTGKVLIEKQSDLSMVTASCMKIVTTGAALQLLAPESRFHTGLEYDGTIDSSKTLQGNLYIRGGGDPCLGSDRVAENKNWKNQLLEWACAVEQLGIQKIAGKVVADASLWEQSRASPHWAWEDIGNYYGAGASALSFHENRYFLFFKPGAKEGADATILRTDPPIPTLVLHSSVKTGPEGSGDRACIYGSELSFAQSVRGTIPAAVSEFSIQGAIPDPAKLCADLFTRELQARGIVTLANNLPEQETCTLFHTTHSPTIEEIVYWANQKSINLYAEHLLKKMGNGSANSGLQAVAAFWKQQGIDLSGFQMTDGSGLSRTNLATTKQLVQMLIQLKQSAVFPLFLSSLPAIDAEVRAKSGSMSLVRGCVGYAGDIAFAILINHCQDPQLMKSAIESVLNDLRSCNLTLSKRSHCTQQERRND